MFPLFTALPLLLAAYDLYELKLWGSAVFTISLAAALLLHASIIKMLLVFTKTRAGSRWAWMASIPLLGYMPKGYVPVLLWSKACRHAFAIGTVMAALLYVWVPPIWSVNFLWLHFALLQPQMYITAKFRKKLRGGLAIINPRDISLYKT